MQIVRSQRLTPRELFSIALAAVAIAGCATAGEKVTVTPLNGLSLGIVNYGGAAAAEADAQALRLFLSQKLGREITPKVFTSEGELSSAIAGGIVDIAWMPPFAFVEAQKTAPIVPLAKVVRHGLPFYRSVLFVTAKSPATTVKDLMGARVAWVDKGSAAGYLFPRAAIVRAGLKPADLFKKETFYGDHGAVCNAVLNGDADVGATFADDRGNDEMLIDGCVQSVGAGPAKTLRIVGKSEPIPNDVIAARADLTPDVAKQVKDMLLELGQSGDDPKLLAVFKADGFQEVGVDDFMPVRFAAEAAGK